MATNRDLLAEAIADAKTVKATAIANAKAALEEAFTPHLTQMLSAKLQEMDADVTEEETEEVYEAEKDSMDEVTLDELLAELEGLDEYGLEHDPNMVGDKDKDGDIYVLAKNEVYIRLTRAQQKPLSGF